MLDWATVVEHLALIEDRQFHESCCEKSSAEGDIGI